MIDVDKLLELEAKATKGPWEAYDVDLTGLRTLPNASGYDCIIAPYEAWGNFGCDESEFIAEMRNSIRQLCLEVKALREFEKAVRVERFIKPPIGCGCYFCRVCRDQILDVVEKVKKLDEARKG